MKKCLAISASNFFNCLLLIVAIQLFCPTNNYSQRLYTSGELLVNTSTNQVDSIVEKNRYFLQYAQSKLPWVDEMDIRTETDEWRLSQQEYLFRMSFNNKAMQKVHRKYAQHNVDFFDLRVDQLDEERLALRYEYLSNWYTIQQEIDLLGEKRIILEDQLVVYKKILQNSLDVNLDDFLKTEERLRDLDQQVLGLQNKKAFAISNLISDKNQAASAQLDTTSWISFETMQQVILEWKEKKIKNSEQQLQDARVVGAQLDVEEENASQSQVIDFVQVKYAGRDNLDFQQEFSLGMGLRIPSKAGSQRRLSEAYIDKFEESFQALQLAEEVETKLNEYYAEFQRNIEQHNLVRQQIKEADLQATYNRLRNAETVSPFSLLRLKESMLYNQTTLLEIENEARDIYLKIIELKGMIALAPINFLSENLQMFK